MALANARVRSFPNIAALEKFIRTEVAFVSIVSVFQDNSGAYICIYNAA